MIDNDKNYAEISANIVTVIRTQGPIFIIDPVSGKRKEEIEGDVDFIIIDNECFVVCMTLDNSHSKDCPTINCLGKDSNPVIVANTGNLFVVAKCNSCNMFNITGIDLPVKMQREEFPANVFSIIESKIDFQISSLKDLGLNLNQSNMTH